MLSMKDRSKQVITNLDSNIKTTFNSNLEKINEETIKVVKNSEEIQKRSSERFESFYNRKKYMDYLIYLNLGITPILLLIVIYIIFIK